MRFSECAPYILYAIYIQNHYDKTKNEIDFKNGMLKKTNNDLHHCIKI